MKNEKDPLLGFRELLKIIRRNPYEGNLIVKKLTSKGICGVVDWNGDHIEFLEECDGDKRVWLEEEDPLRNTGWRPNRAKFNFNCSSDTDYLYFPNIYKTWTAVRFDDKLFFIKREGRSIFKKSDSKSISAIDGEKRTEGPKLPQWASAENLGSCLQTAYWGAPIWLCENALLLSDTDKKEYYVDPNIELSIRKSVVNPRVYWIQPYAVVSDRLNESIVSNFISVNMPFRTFTAASSEGILVRDEGKEIIIETRAPSYMTFSHIPEFSLIHRLRSLIDFPIPICSDIAPDVRIDPPSLLVRNLEIAEQEGGWRIKAEISNPITSLSSLRMRIHPPFYIESLKINQEEGKVTDKNALTLPLLERDLLEIDLIVRKKLFLFSKHD
ncbi:MAG: hypothetical protein QW726_01910 [Fervidicoccaceae archaeon]